jgi:hypothetical protein
MEEDEEENTQNTVDETQADEQNKSVEQQETNAAFKNTPAYKAMAQQIAEMKQAQQAKEKAEADAKLAAEQKALESQGKYEEALALSKSELEKTKAQYEAQIRERDIQAEFLRAGVSNQLVIKGAIAGYKDGDIGEYVRGLIEENKDFLAPKAEDQRLKAPGLVTTSSSGGKVSIKNAAEYQAYKNHENPEIRKQAREYARAYVNKHGVMPS